MISPDGARATMSVNVPPRSTQKRQAEDGIGLDFLEGGMREIIAIILKSA